MRKRGVAPFISFIRGLLYLNQNADLLSPGDTNLFLLLLYLNQNADLLSPGDTNFT